MNNNVCKTWRRQRSLFSLQLKCQTQASETKFGSSFLWFLGIILIEEVVPISAPFNETELELHLTQVARNINGHRNPLTIDI
jgi:hypothetical protein